MNIIYTPHLKFRLKVRNIPFYLPKRIFKEVTKEMNKKPLVNYDSKSDILYIVAKKDREEEFVEVAPGINVELDEKGQVIGIEILNASECLKPVVKSLYKHMQMA